MTSIIDITRDGEPGCATANFGQLQACRKAATSNGTLGDTASDSAPSELMAIGAFPALQGIAGGKSFGSDRNKPDNFQPHLTGE